MMKSLKSGLIVASSLGLLFLGACSSGSNQTATTPNSPAASSTTAAAPAATPGSGMSDKKEPGMQAGKGMVVEAGAYHLEFMPAKEGGETHLDLFLQKGDSHEAISNAKVTAQVQLPDGTQKTLNMKYDTEGKHYTAKLPSDAAGDYKVAFLSDIGGEKVNARYSFKQ